MRREAAFAILVAVCLSGPILAVSFTSNPQQQCCLQSSIDDQDSGVIPARCTVFTVSKGGRVFFGGNDDYVNPDSYYWVDPGRVGSYGAIWIGTPDNVQQGVNVKGLAYDANGLPRVSVHPHLERTPVSGGYGSYPIQILRECATVEEVVAWVRRHQWHSYMHDQMQFADATGDAVIISAGPDGEVAFTRKLRGDGRLVSTNFNVANPSNGFGYPCPRYETAHRMLGDLLRRAGDLTAQDVAAVLDAVHQEGGASWTIESMVADLPRGIVYIYYFHQFDRPLVLNVAEEIARGRPPGPLSKLFPDQVREEAARRYGRIQAQQNRCRNIGKIWVGLVAVCQAALWTGFIRRRRRSIFWTSVVAVLGPLGLATWLAAGRSGGPVTGWRAILVEAAGDVTPTVVAFVLFLSAAVSMPAIQASQPLQLLLVLGLPVAVGWLLFHPPLLVGTARSRLLPGLAGRLPHAWVAANLGLAGINALAMPLGIRSIRICPVLPLSPWTIATWWAIVAVGALAGGAILWAYASWALRRGLRVWSVASTGEAAVDFPRWRKLWWWIPLSCVALAGGMALGVAMLRVFAG